MFGKVENWLGELCAATDDEEGETDLLTYETFDSLIPNEQYENDEDKRSIINDVDSYFNVNRSRKYNVRHVNVRPAPRSETMPSEELDQEDGFDRREAGRQRCLREYNSPGLSVLKNNKSSEARKLESGHKLRKTSSVQKQEYFSNICRGNLFDPQEVTISSGFTKYRFPKSGRKYLEAKPEFSRRHSRKPHTNMLVPCNWTTEALSPSEPEPRADPQPAPPRNPSKQSNTPSRLFRKKQFRFSGKQGKTKEKLEEMPLTRVLEEDKEENKSEQQAKDEDNCSSESIETIESGNFLSHELINKPQHQYSEHEEVFHDPFYVEDPQANQPAECKVNISIINLGNDEGTWSASVDREVKDCKKRLGKIPLPGLKLASRPNMENEADISYTDVEPFKEDNCF